MNTIPKAELSRTPPQHGRRVSGINENIEKYENSKSYKPRLGGRGAMISRL
ncbi:hypothetical protein DIPPA_13133 [Diplonema papillatum]|nr:hypothetical protein DIPPA_13133 [Diplonema papillatum]